MQKRNSFQECYAEFRSSLLLYSPKWNPIVKIKKKNRLELENFF